MGKCHWNWSSPDHLAFKHCSTMAWEGGFLCATAPLADQNLPLLLPLWGVWQMDHRDQGVEGLFLLSSCVGTAWLQPRAGTGVGELSACWCWAGRPGLFFWKLSKSWYSGCAVMPFAGGRKGLAVQKAAGILTSWAQSFSLEARSGLFKSCPCFSLAAHLAVPSMWWTCAGWWWAVQVWICAQGDPGSRVLRSLVC